MKKVIVLSLLCLFVVSANAGIDVVSVNWKQYVGAVNDVLDGDGVVAANNWANLQAGGTSQTDLTLSSGTASTIDMTMTNPGGFGTAPESGYYDNTVFRTGAFVFANPLTLTLSDLSATFTTYDVIVYGTGFSGGEGGNQGAYSDGTSTYYMQRPNPADSSFIQSTDIDLGDGVDIANYVRFSGLTADTATITVSMVNVATGIGGFQIVGEAIPEPATMLLVGLGSLIGLRRKK